MPDHMQERKTLIGEINGLSPNDRAVLVVIHEPDDDPVYHIETFGCAQWPDILGVIASGVAYAQSEMFRPVDDEEPDTVTRGHE